MSDNAENVAGANIRAKKRQGCFRIPKKALDLLIEKKATPWQVGAYLTLARFTDETGRYSTAGFKAISENTGASAGTEKQPGPARRLVDELRRIEYIPPAPPVPPRRGRPTKSPPEPARRNRWLVYAPEDWVTATGETLPEVRHERATIRWVLDDFGGEEWVWFPNELVDGFGRFKMPLKRLKQCGEVAGRLLILLYAANNQEEFGGVPPYPNVYVKYESEHLASRNGSTFWRATINSGLAYNSLMLACHGLSEWIIKGDYVGHKRRGVTAVQSKAFWDAIISLKNNGFIYHAVTVMDGSPDGGKNNHAADARPIYELAIRTTHGHTPKGEEGLASRIDTIFKAAGLGSVADSQGRFNGVFPVISRVGVEPHVVGVYRLHFRITNPKNYSVSTGWKRRQRDQEEACDMLAFLEEQYGIADRAKPAGLEIGGAATRNKSWDFDDCFSDIFGSQYGDSKRKANGNVQ